MMNKIIQLRLEIPLSDQTSIVGEIGESDVLDMHCQFHRENIKRRQEVHMPNVEAPNGYPPEIEPPESSILPAPGDRYEVFRQKMDRIIAEVSVSFACDDGMYEGYEDRSQVGG